MQPITLQLVINLKTAKALDIAIPPSVALKDTSAHHVLIPSTKPLENLYSAHHRQRPLQASVAESGHTPA